MFPPEPSRTAMPRRRGYASIFAWAASSIIVGTMPFFCANARRGARTIVAPRPAAVAINWRREILRSSSVFIRVPSFPPLSELCHWFLQGRVPPYGKAKGSTTRDYAVAFAELQESRRGAGGSLKERQQIRVNLVRIRGAHAVRKSGIDFKRCAFEDLGRLEPRIRNRHNLVVIAVHHERGNVHLFQVFR